MRLEGGAAGLFCPLGGPALRLRRVRTTTADENSCLAPGQLQAPPGDNPSERTRRPAKCVTWLSWLKQAIGPSRFRRASYPAHTQRIAGRHTPILVFGHAQHERASYGIAIRHGQILAKGGMGRGYAREETCPAGSETAGFGNQLQKYQSDYGARDYPLASLALRHFSFRYSPC